MVAVNVEPFEIETTTRAGDVVRADVYLPASRDGPVPVLLGVSPYRKALRYLPVATSVFQFIECGPIQLYLDHGYAYATMDTPGMGRSEGVWDPVSRYGGEAIHDVIEHVEGLDWSIGKVGMFTLTLKAPYKFWPSGRPRTAGRQSPERGIMDDLWPPPRLPDVPIWVIPNQRRLSEHSAING